MKVAVVGLGYVGLPLASLCADKGLSVVGIEIDKEKIDLIRKGVDYIEGGSVPKSLHATDDISAVGGCEIVVVCVPTPVTEKKAKDLGPLLRAIEGLARKIRGNPLVIIESTVNPNAIEREVLPAMKKQGLREGVDFDVAHCPERIDPGNKTWTLRNIPRVYAARSEKGAKRTEAFYGRILDAPLHRMNTIAEAEAVKMVENTFRDVNIAYVNEIAKVFDTLGIDTVKVIEGAATKPFAFMAHYPGCGVGGHCIPVDPYFLLDEAKRAGVEMPLVQTARRVNEGMPEHTVGLLEEAAEDLGIGKGKTKVVVLGVSYKGGVSDDRESPGRVVIDLLGKRGWLVRWYDPYVEGGMSSKEEALTWADAAIICADHQEFREIKKEDLDGVKVVIDGKNVLNSGAVGPEIRYRGIGRAKRGTDDEIPSSSRSTGIL